MYEFSAIVTNNYTVEITSNTYWSCKAEGNFKLSQYNGNGNTSIDIEIPDDVINADGVIHFSFGDERCKYPELPVFLSNMCYISSYPNYVLCNNEKTVFLYYKEKSEVFYMSIFCFDGWTVDSPGFEYISNNNDLMIFASGQDGEIKIIPNHQCNGNNILHIKMKKQTT